MKVNCCSDRESPDSSAYFRKSAAYTGVMSHILSFSQYKGVGLGSKKGRISNVAPKALAKPSIKCCILDCPALTNSALTFWRPDAMESCMKSLSQAFTTPHESLCHQVVFD